MKVAILGYGSQGASSLEYWQKRGDEVTICDQRPDIEIPRGTPLLNGDDYLDNLDYFDVIVRSPSVHPEQIKAIYPENPDILDKVTTNTNEFLKVCPSRNIIGVTGTKGKGTTSTLIARILEAAGKKVHLGGNIGIPPLELLKNNIQPDDWVVLELANFQLIDINHSPHIGLCLMVEDEHMDWHEDTDEYAGAKQQMFRWQSAEDVAIFYAKNELSKQIAEISKGKKIPYLESPGAIVANDKIMIDEQEICRIEDIQLLGEHNLQNVCAAVTAVWQIAQDTTAIRGAIRSFSGLPFRLEFIREVDGVKFYNDSFGTTPETAIVAIKAFEAPKVLILGGSDKGADYSDLAKTVVSHDIRHIVAIGQTAPRILADIDKLDPGKKVERTLLEGKPSMKEIVGAAKEKAQPGDVVLLSTASASFDMFKNYIDRGEQFNQAVRSLA
jgi:UDP-N-acetylmuramoylalanine--D-glutamate ligase